jgi:hypothetical protein
VFSSRPIWQCFFLPKLLLHVQLAHVSASARSFPN